MCVCERERVRVREKERKRERDVLVILNSFIVTDKSIFIFFFILSTEGTARQDDQRSKWWCPSPLRPRVKYRPG